MGRRRQRTPAPLEKAIQAAVEPDWVGVDGFPAYEVSRSGLVRNAVSGCVLKPEAGHRGHLRVTLYNQDGPQRHPIHRLVLQHFVGPPTAERDDCAHWDGEPANNSVGNLRWATPKENAEDARRHGTLVVGEKNHFSKLTEAQAIEIRERVAKGASTRALAEEFRVNLSQVNHIVTGTAWAHLGVPIRQLIPRRSVDEASAVQAIKSVENGLSVSEAARRFGCSRQSINRRRSDSPPEKLIHAAVLEHWTKLRAPGTLVATLANAGAMGQPGLTPGLPDLVVMGPKVPGKIGFVELKTSRGKLSDAQRGFGELCASLGVSYACTVGRDEPIRLLEQWAVVRRQAA